MAIDEFSIPAHVTKAIKSAGYQVDTQMETYIQKWFNWYSGKDDWYDVEYVDTKGNEHKRRRLSVKPAKQVSEEWASLLLTEDTEISVEEPAANSWLKEYLEVSNFWPTGQMIVEKAFALGTGAWALWFDVKENGTTIKLRRYDARMIVPISWDEDGISECAFVTRVSIRGKRYDQLQMHVYDCDTATYHIKTTLFKDSRPVEAAKMGIIEDFDTQCETKTFGVIKPALENTAVDLSPYGMSVFDNALDAIRSVDLAFDSINQEIDLTGVKVFMDEAMIDVRSKNGKTVPITKTDQQLYRKTAGNEVKNFIDVFSPDIRIEPLCKAFDVALAKMGDLCGFGQQYFVIEKAGGLKTATEVTSDNSALMRNVRKHENMIRGAIQDVITALLTCARIHCGADIEEDFGAVSIQFDDSVIVDTQTKKTTMMSEIAAGLIPKWMYAVEFYGMSEDEAKAFLPADEIVDIGF